MSAQEGAAPLGYSIDLCQGVVDEIVRELNGAAIRIDYQLVTSDTRMEAVASGKVDLECGSTTGNIERQKSVAFSPVMFVAGTKLLVKRDSGVNSYRDLTGKILVVTAGTTNETAMKLLNQKYKLGIKIISAPDHEAILQPARRRQGRRFRHRRRAALRLHRAQESRGDDGGGRRFHHL